jgi:hyperosmotically inducible periplasmic protein
MQHLTFLVSLALIVVGGSTGIAHPANTTQVPPAQTAPDNTGQNVRDRGGATLTPGDQGNKTADLTLTQRIRKALMADKSLSTTAKNIKIITVNGLVTLRGPVKTPQEREKIVAKAQDVAGMDKVDNQLEIKGH